MKYYIKSAKGYWLAQGNGYTQNQSEAYAFTRPNVAVCFQSGRLHAPQTVLNTSRGTHYTLLCKVARSYKTITPKNSPKDPQSTMGVFSFRCETATKCQGRRSRAFHP